MKEKLNTLNIPHALLDEAIFKLHAQEILSVYDMLEDKKTKDIYANILYCRLKGIYPDYDLFTENQYYCWNDFCSKNTGTTFIDCGAYVGDSLERYIWYKEGFVSKIIAFEPDKQNFAALQTRSKRLEAEWNLRGKIVICPYGVGAKSSNAIMKEYSATNGLSTTLSDNIYDDGEKIKIIALDDMINEKVDFIKADIESFEYKMLLGAKKTLKKYHPAMAVCIYHNATDFYSIPLFIRSILPSAKMVVRHHSNNLSDTVLYVWE